jgi:hypothetical protein
MTTTLDNQNNIDAVHSSGVNEEPPLCKAEPDLFTGPVNGITGFSQGAVGIYPHSAGTDFSPVPANGISAARSGIGISQVSAGAVPPTAPAPMAGFFWCFTHMADLPTEKQSSDPRYCRQCFENLVKEADDMKATGNRRKAWWTPCNLATTNKRRAVVLGQVTQIKTVSVTPDKCLFCGKELTKQRKTKLFCGATCRVRYSRQSKAAMA